MNELDHLGRVMHGNSPALFPEKYGLEMQPHGWIPLRRSSRRSARVTGATGYGAPTSPPWPRAKRKGGTELPRRSGTRATYGHTVEIDLEPTDR